MTGHNDSTCKNVTIFGGSGFLGRYVVRQLAQAGHRVRVATRKPHVAHYLQPIGGVGQIQFLKTNITSKAEVADAVAGADLVINLVGLLYQGGGQKFEKVHIDGARNIAAAAAESGVESFVHVSSIGADRASDSHYARTKALGEEAVREAFEDAVILRSSVMFGAEDGFFNRFAFMARFSPVLPLIGGGKTRFQPIFVGDVALAVMSALEDINARGRVFELGGPQVFTLKEIMELVVETTQRSRLLVPWPFFMASINGFFLGMLPSPLLTVDQVRLLKKDNVVCTNDPEIGTLADLGVEEPRSAEAIVPTYLYRFRKYGQYATSRIS